MQNFKLALLILLLIPQESSVKSLLNIHAYNLENFSVIKYRNVHNAKRHKKDMKKLTIFA